MISNRRVVEGIFQFEVKLHVPSKHVIDVLSSCSLYASTRSTASGATECGSGDRPDPRVVHTVGNFLDDDLT